MHIEGYGHGYPFEDKDGRVGHPSLFRVTAIQDGTWEPTYKNWTKWNFIEYIREFDDYEMAIPVDFSAHAESHGVTINVHTQAT